jgi:acetyltransferase-like isoleucine patch superfamily enzyme
MTREEAMPQVTLELSADTCRAFAARGLKLNGVAGAGRIDATSRIEAPTAILSTVAPGAFLDVGAFCNLSGGAINNLRCGRYCSIASGVVIGSHEHPTSWLTTSRTAYYPQVNGWDRLLAGAAVRAIHARKRPFRDSCPVTTLGPDVWIGQGAFIKSGITVGAGAIIGARATVLKDVPPYAIVVGTPGRVLRLRFADAVVERLLAVAWWRYSIYDLFDAPMDDIERALDVVEDLVAKGAVRPYEAQVLTAADLATPDTVMRALASDASRLAS